MRRSAPTLCGLTLIAAERRARPTGRTISFVRRAAFTAVGIIFLGILATPEVDAATVITVTKTTDDTQNGCTASDCSLREAILKSNATTTVETIKLGPSTYELDDFPGANEDFAVTGDLDIRRPVIIKGSVLSTSIEQSTADRVFDVIGKGSLKLVGIVVTSGEAVNSAGGGIRVSPLGSLTLDLSIVYQNVASFEGGGIYNAGKLTVRNSRVTDNVVTPTGYGGGISNHGDALLARAEIENNTAGTGGGGMAIQGSRSTTITNSTIAGNQTGTHEGGGIIAFNGEPTITLFSSTVSNNSANTSGGGLWFSFIDVPDVEKHVVIEDSTISGNDADANGGGISAGTDNPGSITISQSTITSNSAGTNATTRDGGGIHQAQDGSITVKASIVAGNIDLNSLGLPDCSENLTTLGSNVVGGGCFAAPALTDAVVGSASFLGPLQANGGPTLTHALDEGSTAEDRHAGSGCAGTDQRGVPRPVGTACDSGSYEYAECGDITVTIVGSAKSEVLNGTPGNDGILGLGGNDRIFGDAGNDAICGGTGNDRLLGEEGDDTLFGQAGDDVMNGGPDADTCVGGPGTDRAIDC